MGALRAERARLSGGLASEGILELGRFCKGLCAHFQPTMVDAKDKDGNTIYDETGKVKKVPVWSTEFKNTFLDLARLAIDAFGKSAPYFEQKLASVHEIRRISLERLTDAELDQLEAIVASASDEGGDTSGEVETRH